MICTPNTGHPVLGVFLCDTVINTNGYRKSVAAQDALWSFDLACYFFTFVYAWNTSGKEKS